MSPPRKSSTRPRVFFVSHNDRFDTKSAEQFGERVFIEPSSSIMATNEFFDEVINCLVVKKYNPEIDFIALTGPVVEVALIMSAVSQYFPGLPIQILIFNARTSSYALRIIGLAVKS